MSGFLRGNGFDPQTIDALGEGLIASLPIEATVGIAQGLPIDEIVNRIADDAKIIGYSAMFSSSWTYDKKILQRIRDKFPEALIVAGGEHITACPRVRVERTAPASQYLCSRGRRGNTFWTLSRNGPARKRPLGRRLREFLTLRMEHVVTNPPRSPHTKHRSIYLSPIGMIYR